MKIIISATAKNQDRIWPALDATLAPGIYVSKLTSERIEGIQIVVGDQLFTLRDRGGGLEIFSLGKMLVWAKGDCEIVLIETPGSASKPVGPGVEEAPIKRA